MTRLSTLILLKHILHDFLVINPFSQQNSLEHICFAWYNQDTRLIKSKFSFGFFESLDEGRISKKTEGYQELFCFTTARSEHRKVAFSVNFILDLLCAVAVSGVLVEKAATDLDLQSRLTCALIFFLCISFSTKSNRGYSCQCFSFCLYWEVSVVPFIDTEVGG